MSRFLILSPDLNNASRNNLSQQADPAQQHRQENLAFNAPYNNQRQSTKENDPVDQFIEGQVPGQDINRYPSEETLDGASNNQSQLQFENEIGQENINQQVGPTASNATFADNSSMPTKNESTNPAPENLVDAIVVDSKTGKALKDADLKLFVDSPNEILEYDLKDGILTFEALPEETISL